jgi:hypothetical protein
MGPTERRHGPHHKRRNEDSRPVFLQGKKAMHGTSERIRNVTFFLLVSIFVLILALFSLNGRFISFSFPVIVVLAFAFGLLGLLLLVLTVKIKEGRLQRTFFLLAGASAAAMPICGILHNLVYALFISWFGEGFGESHGGDEGVFFILAIVVCPALFLVGAAGSVVLFLKPKMPSQ